ncbi:MAG: ACP phosphodiesterase [Raineya sp.]|nr:ACP phosphodiesterase [Raineya sp.]
MNFLAHIFLSGESEQVRIGNFIADAVKGNQWEEYEPEIQKGIHLHRAIDNFTDQHPIVLQGIERLYASQGKYASVAVDIFYDHFLAKNWQKYHPQDLLTFTQTFYTQVLKYLTHLPVKVQYMFPHMQKQNWLFHYQSLKGIERVFEGMSKRTSFQSNLLTAPKYLVENYAIYEQEFEQFFPQIISFVEKWHNTWKTPTPPLL